MVLVREETHKDIGAVRNINESAFGQPAEAGIVDKLRANCADILSLVAVEGDQVVGHILKDRGCPFIIVLGYPGYYPRFGFERASLHGIKCQWEVPDEVFMVLILDKPAMPDACGVARYRPEFDDAV